MKKSILFGVLAIGLAGALYSFSSSTTSSKKKLEPCKKTILFCPSGVAYYKCSTTGTIDSPDCYRVSAGGVNGGCNITEYPCNRGL
ncbi:hypothetical protein [Fluviicola sp.]|uniref:hypothetical protein n=1 Tax=Fluviicola sp. TaxID=1917219 RepID=UPI0031DCFE13